MTKSDLVEALAKRIPTVSLRDAELVVNTVFDGLTAALCEGGRVEVRGFGSFTVRSRRARHGRNPKTGTPIDVPAKRVPFFVAGHDLRDRVNGGAPQEVVASVEDTAA